MKSLILLALFQCTVSFAGERIIGSESIDTAKSYLKKNPSCTVAVGVKTDDSHVDKTVLCITDMTINPGTIKASKGCTLAEFNMQTTGYTGTLGMFKPYNMVQVKEKCSEGGFSKLMDKNAFNADQEGKELLNVRHLLKYGKFEADGKQNTVYLFGAHPSYEKMWRAEISK